jgi:hypothetical protein
MWWLLLLLVGCTAAPTGAVVINYTTIQEKVVLEVPDDIELELAAYRVARYLDTEDFAEIYDLLSEKSQVWKPKDEFVALYAPVMYGIPTVAAGTELFNKTPQNPVLATIVEDIDRYGGYAEVKYRFVVKPLMSFTPPDLSFVKEEDEWKIEGFDKVLLAGCFETGECASEELTEACNDTCYDKKKLFLRENNSFQCRKNLCHCICSREGRDTTYILEPMFK